MASGRVGENKIALGFRPGYYGLLLTKLLGFWSGSNHLQILRVPMLKIRATVFERGSVAVKPANRFGGACEQAHHARGSVRAKPRKKAPFDAKLCLLRISANQEYFWHN